MVQEADKGRNPVGGIESPQRMLRFDRFPAGCGNRLTHPVLEKTRKHRIDPDIRRPMPCRQIVCESQQRCFCGRIICLACRWVNRTVTGKEYDMPLMNFPHPRQCGVRTTPGASEVDVPHLIPGFLRQARQKRILCDTGTSNQKIATLSGEEGIYRLGVPNIKLVTSRCQDFVPLVTKFMCYGCSQITMTSRDDHSLRRHGETMRPSSALRKCVLPRTSPQAVNNR